MMQTLGIRYRWLSVTLLILLSACASRQQTNNDVLTATQTEHNAPVACAQNALCPGKNPLVKNVAILQPEGARPRFSPSGDVIIFDRKNGEFYDVYTSDLSGNNLRNLTENPAINQRNNGNAVFHPSGAFIVFQSEEPVHFGGNMAWLGDPGLGLFSNLWAMDREGTSFYKLTDIPIKQSLIDPTPAIAVVNPVFSPDGSTLIWSKRYDNGGNHNWGKWRIEAADFVIEDNRPVLRNERILYTPERGNYVTCLDAFDNQNLLVAGNVDGQHEYGMDLYALDLASSQTTNLVASPETWEEGSTVSPQGRVAYMTNADSTVKLDFDEANWAAQPVEREYWLMDRDGQNKQRLTYFNDPTAPEYWGQRVLVAAADFSPDGRFLVGTLGVDRSADSERADVQLKVVLIELQTPE